MRFRNFIFPPRFHYHRHLLFWSVYFMYSLSTYSHPGLQILGFWKWILLEIMEVLLNMLLQVPLCLITIYFLLPKYLLKKQYLVFTAMFLGLFTTAYFIYVFNDYVFVQSIHHLFGLTYPNNRVFAVALMNMLLTYPIPLGVTMVSKLLKNWYLKVKENEKLINENITAELQLLKAQMHPHFLFNTLNNIYFFSLNNVQLAKTTVKKLKGIMQYMIEDCDQQLMPLDKEIKMITNYIKLETIRYGNNFTIDTKIMIDEHKMIVPLLMIPFIENSFKHGASKMLDKPWIKLNIEVKEGMLFFSLANNKPSESNVQHNKKGIGLTNVKKRLQLLYPETHSLNIKSTEDTFMVEMHVPLQDDTLNETKIVTNELIPRPA